MALHWHNNGLLTHIGDDFLRCDIYDFRTREIHVGEVEHVQYKSQLIAFGCLPTIAAVVLAGILWAFIAIFLRDGIDWEGAVYFTGTVGLFGAYVFERIWHCVMNRRRAVALTLRDGTSGTLIELEDDCAFDEIRGIVDKYAEKQPGGLP